MDLGVDPDTVASACVAYGVIPLYMYLFMCLCTVWKCIPTVKYMSCISPFVTSRKERLNATSTLIEDIGQTEHSTGLQSYYKLGSGTPSNDRTSQEPSQKT